MPGSLRSSRGPRYIGSTRTWTHLCEAVTKACGHAGDAEDLATALPYGKASSTFSLMWPIVPHPASRGVISGKAPTSKVKVDRSLSGSETVRGSVRRCTRNKGADSKRYAISAWVASPSSEIGAGLTAIITASPVFQASGSADGIEPVRLTRLIQRTREEEGGRER